MIVDVIFEENDASFDVDFGEVYNISDGGFERGYAEGYDDGYSIGETDGVEKGHLERNKLIWDALCDNAASNKNVLLIFQGWDDSIFKPTRDVVIKSDISLKNCFMTDLRPETLGVNIDFSQLSNFNYILSGSAVKYMGVIDMHDASIGWCLFGSASALEHVEKLILTTSKEVVFKYAGFSCPTLKEIRFEGYFWGDVQFSSCANFSLESAKSAILALCDCAETDDAYRHTVTFHANTWKLLDADGNTAPHGGTWRDYITTIKCWNA